MKNREKKIFEEMTLTEKHIENAQFLIESLQRAIVILQENKSEYMPQLILEKEIDNQKVWIEQLKAGILNNLKDETKQEGKK